jgi:membrane-bound lytic murein transglycosylase B
MRAVSLVALALVIALTSASHAQPSQAFDEWLQDLLTEARTRGYSDELLAQTLAGLTPLPRVIVSDRRQPEVTLTFDEYLRRRVTPAVVQRGRELATEHREIFAQVRDAYGVPPTIILAIWGLETRFGRYGGDVPVFQALATLAWEPRRATFFRAQLYDALTMVDRRHIDAASMKGSWAGAMGQPQFMPSSYLAYAVDFDGDSRRDIWMSAADTFASIANYLVSHGWQGDEPWGREVRVTPAAAERAARALGTRKSGCRAMREMIGPAPLAAWQRLGVRRPDGANLPTGGPAASLVRVGKQRFLVHGNYDALLRYNCANYYALAVATLADRIGGGAP